MAYDSSDETSSLSSTEARKDKYQPIESYYEKVKPRLAKTIEKKERGKQRKLLLDEATTIQQKLKVMKNTSRRRNALEILVPSPKDSQQKARAKKKVTIIDPKAYKAKSARKHENKRESEINKSMKMLKGSKTVLDLNKKAGPDQNQEQFMSKLKIE